jgi:nicotinate-nucleotide adenylyltransferase
LHFRLVAFLDGSLGYGTNGNIHGINNLVMKRIAFYGGSFDPIHNGHLAIAKELTKLFALDEFVFIPAFHAPHKKDKQVSSAFHRYSMLVLATNDESKIKISTIELDAPERPFTIETQAKIKAQFSEIQIFFVIGADSWQEIDTWRDWENVLTATNIIVVTRPDYEITFSHVTDKIRARIVDLRGKIEFTPTVEDKIYITDAVNLDVSATEIRQKVGEKTDGWQGFVPQEIVKYIEKYGIYLKKI